MKNRKLGLLKSRLKKCEPTSRIRATAAHKVIRMLLMLISLLSFLLRTINQMALLAHRCVHKKDFVTIHIADVFGADTARQKSTQPSQKIFAERVIPTTRISETIWQRQ